MLVRSLLKNKDSIIACLFAGLQFNAGGQVANGGFGALVVV
jgi:hypothetical protein